MSKLFGLLVGVLASCAAYDCVGKIYNNVHADNVRINGSELSQPNAFITESFLTVGYIFIAMITLAGGIIILVIVGAAIISTVAMFF